MTHDMLTILYAIAGVPQKVQPSTPENVDAAIVAYSAAVAEFVAAQADTASWFERQGASRTQAYRDAEALLRTGLHDYDVDAERNYWRTETAANAANARAERARLELDATDAEVRRLLAALAAEARP